MSDSDTDWDSFLESEKLPLHVIHGDIIDKWHENPSLGPLMLFVLAELLVDDFEEQLAEHYPEVSTFVIFLDSTEEKLAYFIVLSHQNFSSIVLFGNQLTPDECQNLLDELENDDE